MIRDIGVNWDKTEAPETSKKSPSKPNPVKSDDDAQQSALDPSDQKTVVEILMRYLVFFFILNYSFLIFYCLI
jgi:hypothetical protein